MPSGVFKVTDIPKEKVAVVVANYEADSPTPNIERVDQGNGLWTVVATFPGDGELVTKFVW